MDLNFNPNSEIIVGCLPVEAQPVPPHDYKNPYIGACEQCNREIWMSDKKKQVKLDYPKAVCLCMLCCVKVAMQNEGQMSVHNIGEGKKSNDLESEDIEM